jgi:long-chain fatty acid transport protein
VVQSDALRAGPGVPHLEQYKVVKGLTVGAAYESKSWFQDFRFNVPSHQPLDPTTFRPAVDANGNPVILPASVDSVKFNQPSSAVAGLAFAPFESLLLAADVQWIRWSESNGQNLPEYTSDVRQTGAMPWNLNWSDQWVFKVGAQYRATRRLALRAGYDYGKMPLDATRAFENIAFPAVAEHHVTAGLGWDVTDRFTVNLAGMYVPEAKVSGSNPAQQFIAGYQASMSQVAVDMAIGYRL